MQINSIFLLCVCLLTVAFARSVAADPIKIVYLGGDPLPLLEQRGARIVETLASLGHKKEVDFTFKSLSFGGDLRVLPAVASKIVGESPNIIYAGSWDVANEMRRQTTTIPVVFAARANLESPVFRIVQDLQRPEGNLTGFTRYVNLVPKKLQLLREAFPGTRNVGLVYGISMLPARSAEYLAVGAKLGINVYFCKFSADELHSLGAELNARSTRCGNDDNLPPMLPITPPQFDGQPGRPPPKGEWSRVVIDAFVALHDDLLIKNRVIYVKQFALANRPTVYPEEGTDKGALMHYIPILDGEAKAAEYISKLLRGAKVRDLAVQEPQEFDFSVNMTTLRRNGLTMSRDVLARARKVE